MTAIQTRLLLAALIAGIAAGVWARGKTEDSGAVSATTQTAVAAKPGVSGQAWTLIRAWPLGAQAAAEAMINRHGQPDDLTSSMLVWRDKAPFSKIAVFRNATPHAFPVDHQDVILHEIKLRVPTDKVDDLARFNGSLLVDRTRGTVAARCNRERNNFLALNLASEIISGKRSVEQARRFFAQTAAAHLAGRTSPYTENIIFQPQADSADPDRNLVPQP